MRVKIGDKWHSDTDDTADDEKVSIGIGVPLTGFAADYAINDSMRKGEFDNLEGKGKPLKFDGDESDENWMANRIMKNANVLPPWVELHHEIRDAIAKLLKEKQQGTLLNLDKEVAKINKRISKYNSKCPHPLLQKTQLQTDRIVEQYAKWE